MAAIRYGEFTYEIPEEFTKREKMEIERISGYTFGELLEKDQKHWPYGVWVAIAYISIRRAGATISLDEFLASAEEPEIVADEEGEGGVRPPGRVAGAAGGRRTSAPHSD